MTKGVDVTCCATIELDSADQVDKAIEVMDRLCEILTLFQGSRVNWISYDLLERNGAVVRSYCANRITAPLADRPDSPWDSGSFVSDVAKRIYENGSKVENQWNLETVLAFFSAAQHQEKYFEVQSHKIVQCIDLLLSDYLRKHSKQPLEETCVTKDAYANCLKEMCASISIECLSDGESSEEWSCPDLVETKISSVVVFDAVVRTRRG